MGTAIDIAHAVERATPPAGETEHDAMIRGAVQLILDLLRCVTFLVKHEIYVIGFAGARSSGGLDRVIVNVAPIPRLHAMFPDCFWRERRQDGQLTVYTWCAVRFNTRIQWEETCA